MGTTPYTFACPMCKKGAGRRKPHARNTDAGQLSREGTINQYRTTGRRKGPSPNPGGDVAMQRAVRRVPRFRFVHERQEDAVEWATKIIYTEGRYLYVSESPDFVFSAIQDALA